MPSLTTLPPELIFDIADYLEKCTYVNSLCQTSRQLHAVANPYLYRQAVLSGTLDLEQSINRSIWLVHHNAVRHWIKAGTDISRGALNATTYKRAFLRRKVEDPWADFDRQTVAEELVVLREIMETLLESGADINGVAVWSHELDNFGWTALHAAASTGDEEILELCLCAGADIRRMTFQGQTALHVAASGKGTRDTVELLLQGGAAVDINSWNLNGETPLYAAAAVGNESAMVALLENGAEVNTMGYLSGTPLHGVVRSKYSYLRGLIPYPYKASRIMQILFDHGADVDAVDSNGMTALATALTTSNEYGDIVRCLLANRASVDLTDAEGQKVRGLSCSQHAYRRAKQVQWGFESLKKRLTRLSSLEWAKKKPTGVGPET
ncbi:ankyrin repeat-containing domain protein [Aspergillus germanicus]